MLLLQLNILHSPCTFHWRAGSETHSRSVSSVILQPSCLLWSVFSLSYMRIHWCDQNLSGRRRFPSRRNKPTKRTQLPDRGKCRIPRRRCTRRLLGNCKRTHALSKFMKRGQLLHYHENSVAKLGWIKG